LRSISSHSANSCVVALPPKIQSAEINAIIIVYDSIDRRHFGGHKNGFSNFSSLKIKDDVCES